MDGKTRLARRRGVAGSRVRYGVKARAQKVKTGGAQWSDEAELLFFDMLAASGNVRMAAAEVGFTTFTVYRQRRMRPDFAARWEVALAQGYARLEMALVAAANDSLDAVEFDADRPIPKMSVEQAINVLRAHRWTVKGDGERGPGRFVRRRSLAEVQSSIIKKIEAIENARPPA
ncbi:MAG: hypothetical protein AABY88_12390 [Pseudomonadota bacterium]